MDFELDTLEGIKYRGTASEVALKTSGGQLAILPHHEPFTAICLPGPVRVTPASGPDELFAIFGGLVEVTPGGTRILADEAEHSDELIHSEITAAIEKAHALKASATTEHELGHAQDLLDRHSVRLEVSRLRRRRRQPRH